MTAKQYFEELQRVTAQQVAFMARICKKDYIDVEFRVVSEPKQLSQPQTEQKGT